MRALVKSPAWQQYAFAKRYASSLPQSGHPSSSRGPAVSWTGLGAFAGVDPRATEAWKRLKALQSAVDESLQRTAAMQNANRVDWDKWSERIKHHALIDSLRATHDAFTTLNNDTTRMTSDLRDENLSQAWKAWEQSVMECERAVQTSEELVADGVRSLWISEQAPPAWTVDTNEWLESDAWWRKYIERHHHYDPSKDIEDLIGDIQEADPTAEQRSADMIRKMQLFHERSDTPTLYEYMDQLHSSDYYDLHRRTFVEHMIYFLARTGLSHHFFPEIPPVQWIKDMEEKRFAWLQAAHGRRRYRQLKTLSLEEPLDLLPPDSELEHHGEEHFLRLFSKEKQTWELIVARLMADYSFLCFPAVPISSLRKLSQLQQRHDLKKGNFYSLGADVNALFFVPEEQVNPVSGHSLPPSPGVCSEQWMGHCAAHGLYLNSGYADFITLLAQVMDKRGDIWFNAVGETIAAAFARRLNPEDPTTPVYSEYLNDLKNRWAKATLLSLEEVKAALPIIAENAETTDYYFKLLADKNQQQLETKKSGRGTESEQPMEKDSIEKEREMLVEAVNNLKLPALS